jgi:putative membrane protein
MIYLFVITLAVSLRVDGFYETPLLIAISTAFFLLEKTATHMQDPFENRPTDTAMTSIARSIEINLKQMIDDKEVPLPYKADKFFLN